MGTSEDSEKIQLKWSETRDGKEWDKFAIANGGTIYHLWSWRELLISSGLKPLYLECHSSNGRVLAVCPFFYQNHGRFLNLESLPYTCTAGPLIADDGFGAPRIIAALQKAVKFVPQKPVLTMQVKSHLPKVIKPMLALGFQYDLSRGMFVLDLNERSPADIWSNGFKKHDRQAIKFYEQRATFEFATNERDYLSLVKPKWKVYRNVIVGPDSIPGLSSTLGGRFKIAMVTDQSGIPLAGVMILLDPPNFPNPGVHLFRPRYSNERNIHSAVTFINWKVINWAKENGYRHVDFGCYSTARSRTPGSKFYRLRERFEIAFLPTYTFTLPISATMNTIYTIGKRLRVF